MSLITLKKKPLSERVDYKNLTLLRQENLPSEGNGSGFVSIFKDQNEKIYIERKVTRNKVRNLLDQYEEVVDNDIVFKSLTEEIANQIVERVLKNDLSFNACFLFGEIKSKKIDWIKSEQEHKFTSTGIKFWRHQEQMLEFKKEFDGSPKKTVISTHVSPEGSCNLKCSFCSVTYRDTHARIDYQKIQKYVRDLKQRGLKSLILTGGGEPTLYPQFNELVQWAKNEQNLSVALITNGTTSDRIDPKTLKCFSWIRVSINMFPNWEEKINLKKEFLDPNCVVGSSVVYTVEHTAMSGVPKERVDLFKSVSNVADKIGASYIRLLPNCLLEQDQLLLEHENLQKAVSTLGDKRFFQQYKIHGAPQCSTCHQSYFRPYLSEEPFDINGESGSVMPCDSVVLNSSETHFAQKYKLCKPEDILDYIDGKIKHEFDPRQDCSGCVFTDNVNQLDNFKKKGIEKFSEFPNQLIHEEFV